MFALILAPLVLGGCILPVGVQVASMIADGISLVTTDKTLTDHGLSAVTEQDCAMWRVINGEEVCRDYEQGPVMTADAEGKDVKPAEGMPWRPVEVSYPLVNADDMALSVEPKIQVADLAFVTASDKPAVTPTVAKIPTVPTQPAKITRTHEPAPDPVAVRTQGRIFFVIASFSRINGAERFARRTAVLETQVLAGTARGKSVYRVAVGPVAMTRRPDVKAKLLDASFTDMWALTLKNPKVVVEVAALTLP